MNETGAALIQTMSSRANRSIYDDAVQTRDRSPLAPGRRRDHPRPWIPCLQPGLPKGHRGRAQGSEATFLQRSSR
jgi:hypothetical protein